MNPFSLEILYKGNKCTFYTVRSLETEYEISETEKFLSKFKNEPHLSDAFNDLITLLFDIIADEDGALNHYFRQERKTKALPKGVIFFDEITLDFRNFPLRLYCLWMSEKLIVLFNGGEKTSLSAQEGKTSWSFYQAERYANRILEALQDKEIYIAENSITFRNSHNDEDEIIL
jgi:hypothetical protein